MKNFFVAKIPIRSPCDSPPSGLSSAARGLTRERDRYREKQKVLLRQRFVRIFDFRFGFSFGFCALTFECLSVASSLVHRVHAARGVNPSLSGKLFFSLCWCIRDVVHLDSRVHAAIKPSHIGGQHGQESEESEEGEERSEEDCEEDPQGREEEEVSFALRRCRRFDAGTSHEPSTVASARKRI